MTGIPSVVRSTAQDLVILLQQPVPAAELAQLGRFLTVPARTVTIVNICLADPLVQRHLVDAEALRDVGESSVSSRDRATRTTPSRNSQRVSLSAINPRQPEPDDNTPGSSRQGQ